MFQKYKYHLLVLLAGFTYSSYALSTKVLSDQKVDIFNQILWRSFFGSISAFILGSIVIKSFNKELILSRSQLAHVIVNATLYLITSICFIGSIYLGTPIAKATVLSYAYPLPIIILSFFIFKDVPTIKNIVAIIISFTSTLILLEFWKIRNFSQL